MGSFIDKVFDKSLPGLQDTLTLYKKRGEAITSNIANAETPGYRAVDVNFAGELERAFGQSSADLQKTNSRHMDVGSESSSHLIDDYSGVTRPDGNNVDLDIQMARMAKNAAHYGRASAIVRKKLQVMRYAIMRSQK